MSGQRYPRDKDQLLKELDVAMRLGDIRRSHDMKDRLAPKWWETAIVMLLFASALGLLASLFQYVRLEPRPINSWMLFWFSVMILTIVTSFEFLLVKVYNLRRSNDILLRRLDDLRERQEGLIEKFDAYLESRARDAGAQ